MAAWAAPVESVTAVALAEVVQVTEAAWEAAVPAATVLSRASAVAVHRAISIAGGPAWVPRRPVDRAAEAERVGEAADVAVAVVVAAVAGVKEKST